MINRKMFIYTLIYFIIFFIAQYFIINKVTSIWKDNPYKAQMSKCKPGNTCVVDEYTFFTIETKE